MADQVTPTQERYIDPYMQRIFDFDTVDAKVYLSRATNMLLKSIGNNLVLDGFDIENPTITSNTIISVDVNPGLAIQDYVLCENLAGTGVIPKVTLSMDVAGLTDTTVGLAHIGVFLDYQFLHTVNRNDFVLRMYHVPASGFGLTPAGFSAPRSATLIGIICYTKDPVTGYVTYAWVLPELVGGVPDYENWPSLLAETVTFYLKGWKEHYPHINFHDLVKFIGGYEGWVSGPDSAIDESIAVFDGTSGKLIKMIERNVRVIPDCSLGINVEVPCDNVLGTDGNIYRCRVSHTSVDEVLPTSEVTNLGQGYRCKLAHTAAAINEPGVGANWATYWTVKISVAGPAWVSGTDYIITGNRPITGNFIDPETLHEEWTKYWDRNYDKLTADVWTAGRPYITNMDSIMEMTIGNSEVHLKKYCANIEPYSGFDTNFWNAERQYRPAMITGDLVTMGFDYSYGYNWIHCGPPNTIIDNIMGWEPYNALMIWNHKTQEAWDTFPVQYGIVCENQNYATNSWVFPIAISGWQTEAGQSEIEGQDGVCYRCIKDHTSDPTNRPFSGATHNGPGTVSNLANSPNVVGVGTQFLSDFYMNHTIVIDGEYHFIAHVTDDTNLITGIPSELGDTWSTTPISLAHTNVAYEVCDWNEFWAKGGGAGMNPWANGRFYQSRGTSNSFINIAFHGISMSYGQFGMGQLRPFYGECRYMGGSYANTHYGDDTGNKPLGWGSMRVAMCFMAESNLYEDGWEGKPGTIPVTEGTVYGFYAKAFDGGAFKYSFWGQNQLYIGKTDTSYTGQLAAIYAKYEKSCRLNETIIGVFAVAGDIPQELVTPANDSNFSWNPTDWVNDTLVECVCHPGTEEVPPLPWQQSYLRCVSSAAGQYGHLPAANFPVEGITLVTNGGLTYRCIRPYTSTLDTEPGVGASWASYWELFPDWDIGIDYVFGDFIVKGSVNVYKCILAHTSAAITEPGVGASWSVCWKYAGVTTVSPWVEWIRYNTGGFTYITTFYVQALTLGTSWQLRCGTQIIGIINSTGSYEITWDAISTGDFSIISNNVSTLDILQPLSLKEINEVPGASSAIALQAVATDTINSSQTIFGAVCITNSHTERGMRSAAVLGMTTWYGSRYVLGTDSSTVLGTDGAIYVCKITHRSNVGYLYGGYSHNQPSAGFWWEDFWRVFINIWNTGWHYTVDTSVIESGEIYTCILEHTADSTSEPGVGLDWALYWSDEGPVTTLPWAANTDYVAKSYECTTKHTSTDDDRPITGINWATYWTLDTSAFATGNVWVKNRRYVDIGPTVITGQQSIVDVQQEDASPSANTGDDCTVTSYYANAIPGGRRVFSYYGGDPIYIDRETAANREIDAAIFADYTYPTREAIVQCGAVTQSIDIGGSPNYNSYGHIIGTLGLVTNTFNGKLSLYGLEGRCDGKGLNVSAWNIGVFGMANWTNPIYDDSFDENYYKVFTTADVDVVADTITFIDGHGKVDGDIVEFTVEAGTLPLGLSIDSIYTVLNSTPTTLQVGYGSTVLPLVSVGTTGPFRMYLGRSAPMLTYGVQSRTYMINDDGSEYSTNFNNNFAINTCFAAMKAVGGWMQYTLSGYDPIMLTSGDYVIGTDSDYVLTGGTIYRCKINHKAGGMFGDQEAPGQMFGFLYWSPVTDASGPVTAPAWLKGKDYKANYYKCTTTHTSSYDDRPVNGVDWAGYWTKEYIYTPMGEDHIWYEGKSYRGQVTMAYTGFHVDQVGGGALVVNGVTPGSVNTGWVEVRVDSGIGWIPYWSTGAVATSGTSGTGGTSGTSTSGTSGTSTSGSSGTSTSGSSGTSTSGTSGSSSDIDLTEGNWYLGTGWSIGSLIKVSATSSGMAWSNDHVPTIGETYTATVVCDSYDAGGGLGIYWNYGGICGSNGIALHAGTNTRTGVATSGNTAFFFPLNDACTATISRINITTGTSGSSGTSGTSTSGSSGTSTSGTSGTSTSGTSGSSSNVSLDVSNWLTAIGWTADGTYLTKASATGSEMTWANDHIATPGQTYTVEVVCDSYSAGGGLGIYWNYAGLCGSNGTPLHTGTNTVTGVATGTVSPLFFPLNDACTAVISRITITVGTSGTSGRSGTSGTSTSGTSGTSTSGTSGTSTSGTSGADSVSLEASNWLAGVGWTYGTTLSKTAGVEGDLIYANDHIASAGSSYTVTVIADSYTTGESLGIYWNLGGLCGVNGKPLVAGTNSATGTASTNGSVLFFPFGTGCACVISSITVHQN